MTRVLLSITIGSAIAASPGRAQSIVNPQTPIRQGPLTPRPAALEQATFDVICRGGSDLRVDPAGTGRHAVYFQQSRTLPGPYGAGLRPGECSPVDRLFTGAEPPGIQFVDKGSDESISAHKADANRYWRFAVVKTNYGYFDARSYQRVLVVVDRAPAGETAKKPELAKEPDRAKQPADASTKDAAMKPQPTADVPLQTGGPVRNPAEKVVLTPQLRPPDANPSAPVIDTTRLPNADNLQQKTIAILCRGGSGLRVDHIEGARHGLYFQKSEKVPGQYGTGLKSGECSPVDRLFDPADPPGIRFIDMAGEGSVAQHKGASDGYWRFDVVRTNYGHFEARSYQRVLEVSAEADAGASDRAGTRAIGGAAPKVTQDDVEKGLTGPPPGQAGLQPAEKVDVSLQQLAPTAPGNLFQLDDRAIIIVGGRQTTVGQLRQEIAAARSAAGQRRTGVLDDLLAADDRAIIIVGGREMTAARVKQEIQREMRLRSETTSASEAATSELNQAAYRNPMNRVMRNQQRGATDTVVTTTARGAKFQFTWEAARPQRVDGPFQEGELPFVEVGLDAPRAGPTGIVGFARPVAKATGTIYGGIPIPNDSSTWGRRILVWAEIEGRLTPNTLYHYVVSLPAESGRHHEYGTFRTLEGVVSAENRSVTAPAIGIPRNHRETELQTPSGAGQPTGNVARRVQRQALVDVTPHNRGAAFFHGGAADTAYQRMRVQVSDRPPSFDASGRLTFDRPLADVSASGKAGRVKVPDGAIETYVERYSVECNVDGLSTGGRYYYVVTLTNVHDGAVHQERGIFTAVLRGSGRN